VISTAYAAVATLASTPTAEFTSTITITSTVDEQLCVSMSPAEEPVQLLHKQLPALPTDQPRTQADLRASRLIDRYVDQIHMDDVTFVRGHSDRLSIVSPLAKRLAEIRLRRSPAGTATATEACKRKRSLSDCEDDWPETPIAGKKRPIAAWWWQYSGGGGGGGGGGLTLPDGLPSPFHSTLNRHRVGGPLHQRRIGTPSPITPLPRQSAADDSDDYWKTPVGPSLATGVRADRLLSTTSSTTVDDEIICCSDPRSPAVMDETFTLKSRRCLSFVSPPPSDSSAKKRNRKSLKKPSSATSDKGMRCINTNKWQFKDSHRTILCDS